MLALFLLKDHTAFSLFSPYGFAVGFFEHGCSPRTLKDRLMFYYQQNASFCALCNTANVDNVSNECRPKKTFNRRRDGVFVL